MLVLLVVFTESVWNIRQHFLWYGAWRHTTANINVTKPIIVEYMVETA